MSVVDHNAWQWNGLGLLITWGESTALLATLVTLAPFIPSAPHQLIHQHD